MRLALPLVAGQAGQQLMGFVDTAMVGRLGPEALAGVGIGNGLYFAFTCLGLGCVLGMDAPVSQALGAGEAGRARMILGRGLAVGAVASLPLMVAVVAAPLVLGPAGVDPGAAAACRAFLWGRVGNVVPFLLFAAYRSYLQARDVTRPIVVSTVIGNVVNLIGNWLLIFGGGGLERFGVPHLGLPELGVVGSGLASTLASVVMLAVLALAVRRDLQGPRAPPEPAVVRTILRLGLPIGLQILAEVGVFATVSVLAGKLSATAAAGHQIAITLASFTFTVALGIGQATSVRVGLHVGRGDTPRARGSGRLGIGLGAAVMSASALAFLLAPAALARLLTDDPGVLAAALPLLRVAAVFQIFDGVQVVAAGALRGAGDARAPLYANLAGHYAVGLPVAIGLGFGAGLGAEGLWWGLCAGLVFVSIVLALRFERLASRPIARV